MIAKWKNPVLGFDHHTGSWEMAGLSPTETDKTEEEMKQVRKIDN